LQPIETGADQPLIQGIANGLSNARISQTEPGSPDRLKAYGLDTPAVSVDFQLQNGSKHTLLLGDKDFTGIYAYGIVDGAKTVSLLPETLLVSTTKTFDDLRDHSILPVQSADVVSFRLKNPSGELAASKVDSDWKFSKPSDDLADSGNVETLLSAVSNGKFAAVLSEKPEDLSKYGLASPAVAFTATDKNGGTFTLLVGKKDGSGYYARDTSRPMIFSIDGTVYKKLLDTYADLRDMSLLHLDTGSIDHVLLRNSSGTMEFDLKSEDNWTVVSPADLKSKNVSIWKIFSPLTDTRADQIFDHPPADLLAKLAKPAVEVDLTRKDGKKITVRISNPVGDFVFARTSASPALYKLKKQALDDLNFKPSEIVF